MSRSKRIILLLLCFLLFLLPISSEAYLAGNEHHVCSQHHCSICIGVKAASNLVKIIETYVAGTAAILILSLTYLQWKRKSQFIRVTQATLITLKVELLT